MKAILFSLLSMMTLSLLAQQKSVSFSMGRVGASDIQTKTKAGTVIVGGGGTPAEAFAWMIERSGGGDVVVLTSSASNYNDDIPKHGKINSVETINITSRSQANNDTLAKLLRNAEMLFIGGGDQSRYMSYWRGTKTMDAINYLANEKKVPIGGTSAGAAILSGVYFSGEKESITSATALANPYDSSATIYFNDLLQIPFLKDVITDQHYSARKREGRHVAFMAKTIKETGRYINGIAPDEATAVLVDEAGNATVVGKNNAYFLVPNKNVKPEKVEKGYPLSWDGDNNAIQVYELPSGKGSFPVNSFDISKASGGKLYDWFVDSGSLYKIANANQKGNYVLVIHGGAGTILKSSMTDEREKEYRSGLEKALRAGYEKIKNGKSSLDAVQAAINVLEDNPLFNAGKGAVFTHDGKNELDASIMNGKTLEAGAVAGVTIIKNPIDAARAVMEKSEHVMMIGKGAETFAKQQGIKIVDPKYFWTKPRWDGLQRVIEEEKKQQKSKQVAMNEKVTFKNHDHKFGTVGAVALDNYGDLAAGTSTGGMTNKRFGRVGDAPIIGAGTYANNKTVAVSCTGWGEYYIRSVVAYDISAQMEYAGKNVEEASKRVIEKVGKLGGDGGLIALDKNGNMAMPFNTEGMYRGAITKDGKVEIYIYK